MILAKKLLTITALLSSGTAYAGTPAWTVSESSGAVQVSRPGLNAIAITRGGTLRAGDVVSTGKGGRAVLVRGEEYLVVSPGSRLTIANAKPGAVTQVIQNLGNTLFKIKKMATPHFAVETPYLAAVVKGTTFSVTVTASGASVQVTEGRVQVVTLDGGASHLVTPGEIGVVNRSMPYRLTIQGRETTVIDSPGKPAGATSAKAPSTVIAVENVSAFEAGIKTTVSEGPVDLKDLSGGLISGSTSLADATTKFADRSNVKGGTPGFGIAEAIDTGGSGDIKAPSGGDSGTTGRGSGGTGLGAGGVTVGGNVGTGVTLGGTGSDTGSSSTIVGAGAGITLGGSGSAGSSSSGTGTSVGAGAGVGLGSSGSGSGSGSSGSGTGSGSGAGVGAGVGVGVSGSGAGAGAGVGIGTGSGSGSGSGSSGSGSGSGSSGSGGGVGIGVGIGVGVGGSGVGVGIGVGVGSSGGGAGIGIGLGLGGGTGSGSGSGSGSGTGGGLFGRP